MNNLWLAKKGVIMTTKSLISHFQSKCNCFFQQGRVGKESCGLKVKRAEKLIKYLLSALLARLNMSGEVILRIGI